MRTVEEALHPYHCYWHPDLETGLSCSHCHKPICPNCMVQAHVGIRCQECGKSAPMPTYEVKPIHYLKSAATAIGLTLFGSVFWSFLSQLLLLVLPIPISFFLTSLLIIPFGFISGDLISRSVNRKRGTLLAFLAGGTVATTFVIGLQLPGLFISPFYGVLATIAAIILAIQPLRK